MSLFDVAFKNVKRNFKNYFLYFISIAFSIVIYFTFTTLQYNDQISTLLSTKAKLDGPFKAAGIIILIFACIFIGYSNSFFTRKRKKEIALYSMLGIKKKQIGRMLFYETICMGALALVFGILFGTLLSKGFILVLFKLMQLEAIKSISIGFSAKAIMQTIEVFTVIFLIVSMHSYSVIYRFKLIDLFKADSSGEKEPKTNIPLSILGVVLVGAGYWCANNLDKNFQIFALLTIILTIVGTYILFCFFIVFMIKHSKKNKKSYYKGINMIGTSQLLYRIKGNARTLATIAILAATTLTAVGTTFSIYYFSEITTKSSSPFSFALVDSKETKTTSSDAKTRPQHEPLNFKLDNIQKDFDKILDNHKNNSVESKVNIEVLDHTAKLPSLALKSNDEYNDTTISFLSESKAKELLKSIGSDLDLNLKNNDDAYIFDSMVGSKYVGSFKGKYLEINDKKLNFVDESKESILPRNIILFNSLVIVKDDVFKSLENSYTEKTTASLYKVKGEKSAKDLSNDFQELTKNTYKDITDSSFGLSDDFYLTYRASIESSGLIVFIGGFLGLVFLICTGTIIFFKHLSEAEADKFNYDILRKIGVDNKEIKKSVSKQIGFVFLLPLVIGITHSTVALKVLEGLLNISLNMPILITYFAYIAIYLVYYKLTVESYYKSITD